MKIVTIAFASAIALSAVAPAFAYENDLESGASTSGTRSMGQQHAGMHANTHRAFDVRAYAPVYVPTPAPVAAPYDFGIGNQGT